MDDKYEVIVEKGTLDIEKTFNGDLTEEEKTGGIKFEVTTTEGSVTKWLKADGSLSTDKVEFTIADDFTPNGNLKFKKHFDNVPVGEYTVTETYSTIDGYTESVSYKNDQGAESGTTDVTKTGAAKVEITDTYTKITTGSIKIIKNVTVNGTTTTGTEADGTYTFFVMQGTEKKGEASITITNGASNFAFVDSLEQGDYTIVEQNVPADVTVTNDQSITVVAGKVGEAAPFVTFTNDKSIAPALGSLKIKKNVTVNGQATTGTEADGTYKFDVTGPSGLAAQVEISVTNGESNTAVVSDLPEGNYTVTEQAPTNGTSLTSRNDIQVTVDSTLTGDVVPVAEFTNNINIVTGSVQISKAVNFTGDEAADKDTKEFAVTITVKDDTDTVDTTVNGDYGDVTFTDGVATISIKNGEVKNITGLNEGLKVVVEEADASDAFDGYSYDGDSTTSGEATVSGTDMGVVNLVNKYTKNPAPVGKITVTKTVNNPDGVEGVDGKVFKIALKDGDQFVQDMTTGATGSDAKYFSIQNGETLTFDNLTADHAYTVLEDEEDAKVYGAELSVTGSNVTVTATAAGTAHSVTNSYTKICRIEISKVQMYGTTGIIGAKLQMIRVDAGVENIMETWVSQTETKKFALTDGDYIIRELEAPEGYVKSLEDIKFTVVDGEISETNFNGGASGKYTKATGLVEFKNDPIAVKGKLSIHVSEEDTGASVPDAEIEVTGPFDKPGVLGTRRFRTNSNGNITDEKGNEVLDVNPGKYTFKVTKVPTGYKVTTGATGEITVPENKEGHGEAKILPKSGLKITVVDEVTGKPVPGAVVEVKKPDGTTETVTTDENGEINKFADDTPTGDYTITVKKVPDGYTVTVNKEQPAKVTRGSLTSVISKINTDTGGLIITVIDEKTGNPVPGATVEVEKPDGTKETLVTDGNGQITKYTEKDTNGHYTSPTGDYKITVVKVPDGYSVTTGKTETKTVIVGTVVEHIAKIAKNEPPKNDIPAQENTPTNPSANQQSTNGKVITISNKGQVTDSMTAARTGESKVPYFVFGGSMFSLIIGAVVYVLVTKKKREEENQNLSSK